MIDSTALAEMTASFLERGGEIEKHDIIVRDYASPKGSFMMPSANDAPKRDFTPIPVIKKERAIRTNRKRDKIAELLFSNSGMTAAQIAVEARSTPTYVHVIAAEIGAQLPDVNEKLRAAMFNNKGLSVLELVKMTGYSKHMVRKLAKETGYKLRSVRGPSIDESEYKIKAIDTANMTRKEISNATGISQSHVCRLLARFNLPSKPAR